MEKVSQNYVLSRAQIDAALNEGRRVLSRQIVDEKTWQLDLFEWEWSRLIRHRIVDKTRGEQHGRIKRLFLQEVEASLAGTHSKALNGQWLYWGSEKLTVRQWVIAKVETDGAN